MNKISKKRYKELSDDLEDAEEEVADIKKEMAEIEKVMDNCPNCEGSGQVEDGYGDPAYNPYQSMLYRDCQKCKGNGYVE
jgi:DnaJ-class molecular chaperone